MAGPLLVGAENVILIKDEDSYAASRPVNEGLELVTQLSTFPTSRMIVSVSLIDTDPGKHFCRINGLPRAAVLGISPEDVDIDPAMAQWYAIERQRSSGPINMVVTAYPEVFKRCLNAHQPALLFGRRGAVGTIDLPPTWEELRGRVVARRDAVIESELKDLDDGE